MTIMAPAIINMAGATIGAVIGRYATPNGNDCLVPVLLGSIAGGVSAGCLQSLFAYSLVATTLALATTNPLLTAGIATTALSASTLIGCILAGMVTGAYLVASFYVDVANQYEVPITVADIMIYGALGAAVGGFAGALAAPLVVATSPVVAGCLL